MHRLSTLGHLGRGQVTVKHPARYSIELMGLLADAVDGYPRVLDPFGGTGERLAKFLPRAVAVEIEHDWASCVVGDATRLPFADGTFDAIVTSPCYGNRFADHHHAADASRRRSYTHDIGHDLHDRNAGAMHWGDEYRLLHLAALVEWWRVLGWGGRLVVNMKNHVRGGVEQLVVEWWIAAAAVVGFVLVDEIRVDTPSLRHGENHAARIEYESILIFDVPDKRGRN